VTARSPEDEPEAEPEAEPAPAREIIVVKLGGTTLAEQRAILAEAAYVARTWDVVLVLGGGKRLTEWLERMGVESHFADGLRVTDDAAMDVALAVLRGLVNGELVAALQGLGMDAVGISGIDGGLLVTRRLAALGRVAAVEDLRPAVLYALLAAGKVPVVAPVAMDQQGVICNVNADEVAAGLAGGLNARLVLLTDSDGVRDAKGERLPVLRADDAERLIAAGVITGGMVPKVRSSLRALRWPGAEAVIADGSAPAALSRALDDPGFGTRLRGEAERAPGSQVSPGVAG
jgi:acetylglutamate kinase